LEGKPSGIKLLQMHSITGGNQCMFCIVCKGSNCHIAQQGSLPAVRGEVAGTDSICSSILKRGEYRQYRYRKRRLPRSR
jgi:hypothetical protein